MRVAFFGTYLFLVPLLLEKFDFVDIYLEESSLCNHSARSFYDLNLATSGRTKLHLLPPGCHLSSLLPTIYEIGFAASFGRIFRRADIVKFRYLFNLHPGPVSLARGRHPLPCAVKYRHPYIGITLHQITDESIDSGPILYEWKLARPDLVYQDLDAIIQSMAKVSFQMGIDLICKTFPDVNLAANKLRPESYYPPLSSSDLSEIINQDQ